MDFDTDKAMTKLERTIKRVDSGEFSDPQALSQTLLAGLPVTGVKLIRMADRLGIVQVDELTDMAVHLRETAKLLEQWAKMVESLDADQD